MLKLDILLAFQFLSSKSRSSEKPHKPLLKVSFWTMVLSSKHPTEAVLHSVGSQMSTAQRGKRKKIQFYFLQKKKQGKDEDLDTEFWL